MQITRVHTALYKPFDPPLRTPHTPGGSRPRPGLDNGPMKLVPPHPGTGHRERTVTHGHGIPITEGEPISHPSGGVEHPAHGPPVQLPAQIQQPGTLGGNGRTTLGESSDRLAQGLIGGQLSGKHLGKPAPDNQPPCPIRQLLIPKRIEHDDLGPGGPQQLDMLGIGEREGGTTGESDDCIQPVPGHF